MTNLKNTLDELKDILTEIKTKQDAHQAWTGSEQADMEKRIKRVYDKSNPRHTNLTQNLDIDLQDLESLDKTLGQDKIKTAQQISQLQTDLKKAQDDNQAKDALIKQKDEEIGQKITADFITKLENLTKEGVKVDETKLTELKTLLSELKTKKVEVDASNLPSKESVSEIKEELKKGSTSKTTQFAMGACILAGLTCLGIIFLLFTRSKEKEIPTHG